MLYFTVFHFLLVMFVWSYYAVVTSPPGSPRKLTTVSAEDGQSLAAERGLIGALDRTPRLPFGDWQ